MSGLVDGTKFALDAPTHVEAVWGDGSHVLWAQGEPLMIAKPDGVGGTTVAQQLTLCRAGIVTPTLFGLAVTPHSDHRVLYLALDRPRQAARSMRRMVSDTDRKLLEEGVVVWTGPLPFDLVSEPGQLVAFAQENDATTVVIDSLKDVASNLSDEVAGQAINRALQLCVDAGVEVLALHHQRKAQGDNKKPRALADVYGSRWLTAGCGSVIMLWGEPGDPLVELAHLKQPADEVGPLTLLHDSRAGTTIVEGHLDVVDVLGASSTPLTARDVAMKLFKASDPSRLEVEKAKRRLTTAVDEGRAERVDPGGRQPVLWTLSERLRTGVTDVTDGASAGEVTDPPYTPVGGGGPNPRYGSGYERLRIVNGAQPLPPSEPALEVAAAGADDGLKEWLSARGWTIEEWNALGATAEAEVAEREATS